MVDNAEDPEDDGKVALDETELKRLILSFEKKSLKNQVSIKTATSLFRNINFFLTLTRS